MRDKHARPKEHVRTPLKRYVDADQSGEARLEVTRFESAVAQWLDTVTTHSTGPDGHDDTRDVVMGGFLIECKDHEAWDVPGLWAVTEAKAEAAGLDPVLVIKRPQHSVADALIVTRLKTFGQ